MRTFSPRLAGLTSALLLVLSFAIILTGALLFTNAVEWLGHELDLGKAAVGSLLAAVATALPESLIPVVAVLRGTSEADDVAAGAILGAPFLLATLAMALVGVAAFAYRQRRPQGLRLDVHPGTLARDLGVFLAVFAGVLLIGVAGAPAAVRVPAAAALVVAYVVYALRTLEQGGDELEEEELSPLVFDRTRSDAPSTPAVLLQLAVSLGAILGGAHLFVEQLLHLADSVGVAPLVLALVIAPFATELPEKLNSFFWVREGKDALALGNVTGAMVFQSTIPVAFALAFTPWELGEFAVVAGVLALAGGAVAVATLWVRGRFVLWAVLVWVGLYAAFVVDVVVRS
jgi:cation:H+ antiporter